MHAVCLKNGKIHFGPDGSPRIKSDRLVEWLRRRTELLAGLDGLPLPVPEGRPEGDVNLLSTVNEDWGILRIDPQIAAWSNLIGISRNLTLLESLQHGQQELQPDYRVIPRIDSTDPSQERLFSLTRTGLFVPRNGRQFLVGQLEDLDLRASEPSAVDSVSIPSLPAFSAETMSMLPPWSFARRL